MKTQLKKLLLLFCLATFFNSANGGVIPKCLECGTGADGSFHATADMNLPGGTYHYTSFTIDAGVMVTVTGTQPLIIYCQGTVDISGTINASGQSGTNGVTFNSAGTGGLGVAGGGNGGNGAYSSTLGPLDGNAGTGSGSGGYGNDWSGGGGAGHNGAGQIGNAYTNYIGTATAGSGYGNIQLNTITAGSGGGGGSGGIECGAGGGGGGGGIVIIHSCIYIYIGGAVIAQGGNGGSDGGGNCGGGGGGSGGAIWLAAPEVYQYGTVSTEGGAGGGSTNTATGGSGANGRIRIDYNYIDNQGTIFPAMDFSVNILSASVDSFMNVSCNGDSDGAIYTTVSSLANVGPAPTYTYMWSNLETTDDITSLTNGVYTLSIVSNYGCLSIISKTIYEPTPITVTTDNITDVTCNGATDGDISISVNAGIQTGTLLTTDFNSNNGSSGNMFDFNVLQQVDLAGFEVNMDASGTVRVYYKSGTFVGSELDSTGWTSLGTYSVISMGANAPTELILNTPLVLAPGNYSLAIYCDQGNWNYIDGTLQGNLWASDSYFEIYEGIGKGTGGPFTNDIYSPRNFSGSFVYTATFDITDYLWSNAASTEDISGIGGGDYNLTLTNSNNCTAAFGPFTVAEPDALEVTSTVTVTGNTGDITTTVTGGTSPYSYLWDNNATTADLDDVAAGIYSVVVTDDNGCTATVQDTVDIPVGLLNSKIENAQVALYPNPASGLLNLDVQFSAADNIMVEIFDLSGQLIESASRQDITFAQFQFNLSNYAAGVYMLKLKSSNEAEVHRVSVQR